jgi:hypothetical protein
LLTSCISLKEKLPGPVVVELPSLDHLRPPYLPDGLLDQPTTEMEILHNSVVYEFAMYDWMVYAIALEYRGNEMPDQAKKIYDGLQSILKEKGGS